MKVRARKYKFEVQFYTDRVLTSEQLEQFKSKFQDLVESPNEYGIETLLDSLEYEYLPARGTEL